MRPDEDKQQHVMKLEAVVPAGHGPVTFYAICQCGWRSADPVSSRKAASSLAWLHQMAQL